MNRIEPCLESTEVQLMHALPPVHRLSPRVRMPLFAVALALAVAAPSAGQTPPADPVTHAALADQADGLAIGKGGFLKFGLLLQGWVVAGHKNDAWNSGFRVRRAEIHAKGDLVPGWLRYGLMVDPAKVLRGETKVVEVKDAAGTVIGAAKVRQAPAAYTILQDFWIGLTTRYADISVGQFKTPISWEGYNSSSALLFTERALAPRTLGDRRDLGIKVEKRFRYVSYFVGLFNGQGANNTDMDNAKDVAARVEVTPLPWLMIGGMAYATLRDRWSEPGIRDVFEADLRIDFRPILFQAEYLRSRLWDDRRAAVVTSQGFYAAFAGYPLDVLRLAVRVGLFDEDVDDVDAARTAVWEGSAGIHWLPRGDAANLKLDYHVFIPTRDTAKRANEHQVILAGQVKF
jgi:hypothetical protein